MTSPRLHPSSLFTLEDQERLYAEAMGRAALQRNIKAQRLASGKCVCTPSKLKRRWDGERMTVKTVHQEGCPKRKPWMEAA